MSMPPKAARPFGAIIPAIIKMGKLKLDLAIAAAVKYRNILLAQAFIL
jgi:hypothetical protein